MMARSFVSLMVVVTIFGMLGCSQEPPVEKEIITSPPPRQSSTSASKQASVHQVSSSHQEEAARQTASEPSSETASTGSGTMETQEEGAAVSDSPLEAKEGYRVVKASAMGGRNELHFLVPDGWESTPPKSSMRLLQLSLPGESNAESHGELTVFYFGPSAGTVQMNIDRWIGQFTQPDGSSSKDKAKTEEIQGDHYTFTLLDLSGTMAASTMPGMPPQPERANYRLLAAIVKTPVGPWFVKATGPEATMARWREAFIGMCKSATLSSGGGGSGSGR